MEKSRFLNLENASQNFWIQCGHGKEADWDVFNPANIDKIWDNIQVLYKMAVIKSRHTKFTY